MVTNTAKHNTDKKIGNTGSLLNLLAPAHPPPAQKETGWTSANFKTHHGGGRVGSGPHCSFFAQINLMMTLLINRLWFWLAGACLHSRSVSQDRRNRHIERELHGRRVYTSSLARTSSRRPGLTGQCFPVADPGRPMGRPRPTPSPHPIDHNWALARCCTSLPRTWRRVII